MTRWLKYSLLIAAGLFYSEVAGGAPQDLSVEQLARILCETDSLRKKLVYTGVVDLFSGVEPKSSKRLRVWRVRDEYYHQEEIARQDEQASTKGRRFYLPSLPSEKYLSLLFSNYTATIEPSEQVADRKTKCLSFIPKHKPRFGVKIWLDVETAHILKREIWYFTDSGKNLVMFMKYENIQYNQMPPDSLWKQRDRGRRGREESPNRNAVIRFDNFDQIVGRLEQPFWVPTYLPPGTELVTIKLSQEKERKVLHYHYTDGLLNLSVFQFLGKPPASVLELLKEPPAPKSLPDFREVFAAQKKDNYFLIIGNFPPFELRKIAESLQLKR